MKTLHDISIFLVDDDPEFLKSLAYHLQHRLRYSVKIKSLSDGETCLNNLSQKPDIIILDYILNGVNPFAQSGIQVLKKIKESNPEIEIIMLSGHEKVDAALEAIKYGAFDYVLKNEDVYIKLPAVLRNVINSIAVKRQLRTYRLFAKTFIALIVVVVSVLLVKHLIA